MLLPTNFASRYIVLNNSNRPFISRDMKLFAGINRIQQLYGNVYVSVDCSLFTPTNIHPFSLGYLFITHREWKRVLVFFFVFWVDCCQGTVSRSASSSQSRKSMVKSVDLFELYSFSCEVFFGLLVSVCGKQYEMGTEKNSVTDTGYA